eukprot:TRINITY_DN757_c0_g1_i1.p1 TRINITY_DN757_c0_g1~~TRINITY_DN757_c0_g1_i1.p1  ORF type:complete len:229 (-),score=41.50 TRINITY_DN757_c0_g1_i1:137-823(-)
MGTIKKEEREMKRINFILSIALLLPSLAIAKNITAHSVREVVFYQVQEELAERIAVNLNDAFERYGIEECQARAFILANLVGRLVAMQPHTPPETALPKFVRETYLDRTALPLFDTIKPSQVSLIVDSQLRLNVHDDSKSVSQLRNGVWYSVELFRAFQMSGTAISRSFYVEHGMKPLQAKAIIKKTGLLHVGPFDLSDSLLAIVPDCFLNGFVTDALVRRASTSIGC